MPNTAWLLINQGEKKSTKGQRFQIADGQKRTQLLNHVFAHMRGTPRGHTNTYEYLQILNIHCFSLRMPLSQSHTQTVFTAKLYSAEV